MTPSTSTRLQLQLSGFFEFKWDHFENADTIHIWCLVSRGRCGRKIARPQNRAAAAICCCGRCELPVGLEAGTRNPESWPLAFMGRFPSSMGGFPTLMGRFPSWKSLGKQSVRTGALIRGRHGGVKKRGGWKTSRMTPLPKRGFGPPLVRYVFHPPQVSVFPPPSGVSALFLLYKNPRQSRPEALLEGPNIFGRVRSLVRFPPPPMRFAPPPISLRRPRMSGRRTSGTRRFPRHFWTAIFPRKWKKRQQEPELPDLAWNSQTSFFQTSATTPNHGPN